LTTLSKFSTDGMNVFPAKSARPEMKAPAGLTSHRILKISRSTSEAGLNSKVNDSTHIQSLIAFEISFAQKEPPGFDPPGNSLGRFLFE
jgi:hypothetical protein